MEYNIINKSNYNFLNKFFFFIVFSFPVAVISGSAVININLIILTIIILFFFSKKIKTDFFENKLSIYIFVFIFLVFFNSIIHAQNFTVILKSLGNYRYLFLTLAVYLMLVNCNEWSKKIFIYFNIFVIIFLGLDILYQYIFKKDIFGLAPGMCDPSGMSCQRFSGIFGEELIAGAYLSQFGLLIFFLCKNLKNEKSFYYKILEIIYILFLYIIILITGERNAIVVFLLTFSFFYFFQKKFLNLFFFLILFFILSFSLSLKIKTIDNRFFNIINSYGNIYGTHDSSTKEKILHNPWSLHYRAAFEIFLDSPIVGYGTKSFRNQCKYTNLQKKLLEKQSRYSACSTHPHNYLLEFLAEQGLIGGILFVGLILGVIIKILTVRKKRNLTNEAILLIGLGSLILAIMFPLKPSGSFFSTFNASILFYIIGFFLYYSKKVE